MSTKRSYGEACRFAHALDLVGERWALLVVRELLLGPKRFTDLQERASEREHQHPGRAASRARGGRRRAQAQAAAAGRLLRLRADRVGSGAGADRDPASAPGAPAHPSRPRRPRSAPTRSSSRCARSSIPTAAGEIESGPTRCGSARTSSTSSSAPATAARSSSSAAPPRSADGGDRDRPRDPRRRPLRPALRSTMRPGGGRRSRSRASKRSIARFLRLFPMPEPCAGAGIEPAAVGAA